jgi:hypothetical protein|nr:MAG TPA: hypothetical protein [Caudoviricetes sp.]
MISAKEARELSKRNTEYNDKLKNYINKIDNEIRKHASYSEDDAIQWTISKPEPFRTLSKDLEDVLRKNGYDFAVKYEKDHSIIQISW